MGLSYQEKAVAYLERIGYSDLEIAERLGIHKTCVYRRQKMVYDKIRRETIPVRKRTFYLTQREYDIVSYFDTNSPFA